VSGAGIRSGACALAGFLGLLALILLGAELFTITARTLKDAGEGWSAYQIAAAAHQPGLLYPAKDSLFINNDPPLFFFLAGWIDNFTTDAVIAGRLLAFFSTIGAGIALALAARLLGAGRLQAMLAAILFWAAPFVIVRYAAINDPQMLGNVLDAIGLVLLLARPRNIGFIALSALFLAAALFVKPLFVVLPLALLVWLSVFERRSALLLAGFGLAFALIGYGLVFFTLHVELLSYVFSSRSFAWSSVLPGQWLVVEAPPLLASLLLFRLKQDRFAFFAALYAALAFGSGVIFSGFGSPSAWIDADMAVALGSAVFLARAPVTCWTYSALGVTAVLQGAMLALSFLGVWGERPTLPEAMGSRYATNFDTLVIKRHPDPVLCETLALCYWASKPGEADVFNLTQAIRQGARPGTDLTHLFESHYFSMIQLAPGSVLMPPSPLWLPLVRNYYLEHQDRNGMFLIPRFEPFHR
jgi:hypothetical protein